MCFSMPAQVIKKIDHNFIEVIQNNKIKKVKSVLLDKIKINEWILVNADIAVSKISAQEAKIIMEFYKQ